MTSAQQGEKQQRQRQGSALNTLNSNAAATAAADANVGDDKVDPSLQLKLPKVEPSLQLKLPKLGQIPGLVSSRGGAAVAGGGAGGVGGAADAEVRVTLDAPSAKTTVSLPFGGRNNNKATLSDQLEDALAAGDDDDVGEDDEDWGKMQDMIQSMVATRRNAMLQKQQHIIQELEQSVSSKAGELEAAVAKDVKDSTALCRSGLSQLQGQLEDCFTQITELHTKYQADMRKLWERYSGLYDQVAPTKAKVKANLDKRRAALKRKASEFEAESLEKLSAAEKQLSKTRDKAGKVPALMKVFKAAMA